MYPKFAVPQTKEIILGRPVWVKGKGLPKDGVYLFSGDNPVTARTDNGRDWYLLGYYKGKTIRVATTLT